MIRSIILTVLIGAVLLLGVWAFPVDQEDKWMVFIVAVVLFVIALRRFNVFSSPGGHR
jgi:uncharacterized membrane protein YccC